MASRASRGGDAAVTPQTPEPEEEVLYWDGRPTPHLSRTLLFQQQQQQQRWASWSGMVARVPYWRAPACLLCVQEDSEEGPSIYADVGGRRAHRFTPSVQRARQVQCLLAS